MIVLRALVATSVALLVAACSGPTTPQPASTGALTARPATPTDDLSAPGATDATPPTSADDPTPSDSARARFVAAYVDGGRPRDVSVDLDGDGVKEVVVGYVEDGVTEVSVGRWTGDRYEAAATVRGGAADDVVDLVVRDVNGDGATDIATFQRVGASGHSLSLWTARTPGAITPISAVGGCFDGANTLGDTGAYLSDEDGDGDDEVRAVCEDPDLPQPLWPTVVYLWEDGAYRCDREEVPEGDDRPCREGRGPSPNG